MRAAIYTRMSTDKKSADSPVERKRERAVKAEVDRRLAAEGLAAAVG